MYKIFISTFTLLLYLLSGEIYAAPLYDTVQKGNKLYQDGKFDEALKTFVDGQIEYADDANLKYNISSSQYKMKNYDEAVKGYLDVATTAKDTKLAEKALFNCGNAQYRQGKLEDAIEYYKKALELDPSDQDAKHNLEFAREELKRRINEAKETEKKQQEQKQQQNQEQKQQDQDKQQEQQQPQQQQQKQSQEQAGKKQKDQQEKVQQEQKEQQPQAGEQKPEEQQQAQQGQLGTPDKKEGEKSEEAQAVSQQARKMTKEEAEQLLNTIEENREKFAKKKEQEGHYGQSRPEKDW